MQIKHTTLQIGLNLAARSAVSMSTKPDNCFEVQDDDVTRYIKKILQVPTRITLKNNNQNYCASRKMKCHDHKNKIHK